MARRRSVALPVVPFLSQLPSIVNSIYNHVTLLCGAAMAETAGSAILAPHNKVLRDTIATPREDIQHTPQSYEHSQNIFMTEDSTGNPKPPPATGHSPSNTTRGGMRQIM